MNHVLAIEQSTGLLRDICRIVFDFVREAPRPFTRAPMYVHANADDRSPMFSSGYEEDLYTLPGVSFF